MSDLFHARVPLDFIRDVFDVCRDTPRHTYQVLTKRSLRLRRSPTSSTGRATSGWVSRSRTPRLCSASIIYATSRRCPLPVVRTTDRSADGLDLDGIHWVIAGGESGPNYRPVDVNWVRGIRDTCQHADVAFFFKQWGGRTPKALGRELDGQLWDEMPQRIAN